MELCSPPGQASKKAFETALEEAKNKACPKLNETIKKLTDAAAEKLETHAMKSEGVELRETRLRVLHVCTLRDARRGV